MRTYGMFAGTAIIVLSSMVFSANAQVAWSGGVKGGVGFGKFYGDDTTFTDSVSEDIPGVGIVTISEQGDLEDLRTGFSGGGFLMARFTDNFGIQLEVLYVQKGGKGKSTSDISGAATGTGTADFTFKVDYVDIPLLAVGSFPTGRKATINLFAGPTLAFKVTSKQRVEGSVSLTGFAPESFDDEADLDAKSTDFGLTFGAGVEFPVHERASILLDGRYYFGFLRIPEDAVVGGETFEIDIKSQAFAFMAGVSIPFGSDGS